MRQKISFVFETVKYIYKTVILHILMTIKNNNTVSEFTTLQMSEPLHFCT